MKFLMNSSLLIILLFGFITGEIHDVCEICSCDNLDKPMIVNCDSKTLSTLNDITFNYSSIETLTFINNSLTLKSVDDLAKINNITSLKSLDLSNNPLATIPELSSSHLVNLRLENTYLKTAIFPKSYENCTNLQSIVLSSNQLTKITSDNFKSLSSLTKLYIDNAQLTTIEQDAFISLSKSLQSISLESNSLKSAEFISPMNNLLSINLDKNKLKKLPTGIMNPGQTKHFFFRDNLIEILDELSPLFHWMKTNITTIDIYLNNNPFDCCQSRWFIHYLNGPSNLVQDSSNLTCASPKLYTGKRLIDLRADLMDCSTVPSYPSNISKLAIIILCLIGVVSFILIVVGVTLYRRNRLPFHRRQAYVSIDGDNLPA